MEKICNIVKNILCFFIAAVFLIEPYQLIVSLDCLIYVFLQGKI